VNGEETKIYKTNLILRSICLEPGEHEIEFVFTPQAFTIGIWISLGALFMVLTLLVYDLKLRRFRTGEQSMSRKFDSMLVTQELAI